MEYENIGQHLQYTQGFYANLMYIKNIKDSIWSNCQLNPFLSSIDSTFTDYLEKQNENFDKIINELTTPKKYPNNHKTASIDQEPFDPNQISNEVTLLRIKKRKTIFRGALMKMMNWRFSKNLMIVLTIMT